MRNLWNVKYERIIINMGTKEGKIIKILVIIIMLMIIMSLKVSAVEENTTSVATAEEFAEAIGSESYNTIILTGDVDLDSLNTSSEDRLMLNASGKTIDLNKHKISATNSKTAFKGTNFIMKNGTFDAKGGACALFIGDDSTTNNVTIEDVTTVGGINVYNANNVIIRNVKAEGTLHYAVWCDRNGHVIIESGTFKAASQAILGINKTDGEINIEGGIFITEGKKIALDEKDEDGNAIYNMPKISGGTFDAPVPVEYCKDGFEPVELGENIYSVCNHENTILKNVILATDTTKRLYR